MDPNQERLYFYRESFEKISEDKQNRILNAAIEAFAMQGYAVANINDIAYAAGISIGSMYSYFGSKENLFLAVVDRGYTILDEALQTLSPDEGSVYDVLEKLLRITLSYSRKHPHMGKLYHSLTTEELSPLSERLIQRLEMDFKAFYEALIHRGIASGEIREDVDVALAALYIDDIVVMLELAFSTTYHGIRLQKYLGADALTDDDRVCCGMLEFIRRSLA